MTTQRSRKNDWSLINRVADEKSLEYPLNSQAPFVLTEVGPEGRQTCGREHPIWSKTCRSRLVEMRIHELRTNIEVLNWRPDEVGADPAFLKVRDANRTSKPGQRIGRIMHLHIRAIEPRAPVQSWESIGGWNCWRRGKGRASKEAGPNLMRRRRKLHRAPGLIETEIAYDFGYP